MSLPLWEFWVRPLVSSCPRFVSLSTKIHQVQFFNDLIIILEKLFNWFVLVNPGIKDRTDPRWVGAWWVGFMVLGTAIIMAALPLFFFPPQLKKELRQKPDIQKTNKLLKVNKTVDSNPEPSQWLSHSFDLIFNWNLFLKTELWIRLKRLVKNPIYVCYIIGTNVRLFAVLGYWTFKSKYIESEYKKSASTANLFSGQFCCLV